MLKSTPSNRGARNTLRCLAETLSSRQSVRWYTPEPVPASLVEELLRCAALAPSAHNRQPWRFAVLTGSRSKVRLAESMAAMLKRDRQRDGDPSELIESDAQRSVRRIVEAPVVIVVSATMTNMDRYPDARRMDAERVLAIQGTAMAVQNLLLVAHDAGLGACIVCAPVFCPDVVIEALDLPCDWLPQCAVTLGWPGGVGPPRERRPLTDVTLHVDRAHLDDPDGP